MAVSALVKRLLPRGRALRRIRFGPAAGALMPLDLQCELRMYLGVYERELWPHYRRLLRPGTRSFDLGGRDGYSALLIHRLTGAEVVSIECDPAAAAAMRDTFAGNGGALRVEECRVGCQSGGGAATLDELAQRHFVPAFIKMDVEGAEADVLRGGQRTLAHGPSLIIEVHGVEAERDCLRILGTQGYDVVAIDASSIFPEQRPLAHNRWLACTAA
jgi:hypothetical protein